MLTDVMYPAALLWCTDMVRAVEFALTSCGATCAQTAYENIGDARGIDRNSQRTAREVQDISATYLNGHKCFST